MHPGGVDSKKAAVEAGNAASARPESLAERERAADERERTADERERAEQGLTAMEALAVIEDQLARTYEELAARSPGRRDECRRAAEQARMSARKAREVVYRFSVPTNPR